MEDTLKNLFKFALCGALILPSLAHASAEAEPQQARAAVTAKPSALTEEELGRLEIIDAHGNLVTIREAKKGAFKEYKDEYTDDEEFRIITELPIITLYLDKPNITLAGYKHIEKLTNLNDIHKPKFIGFRELSIIYDKAHKPSKEIIQYLTNLDRCEKYSGSTPGVINFTFF